jgi:hypothetical protein
LPVVDEKPERAHTPNFMTERPRAPAHATQMDQHGKVFIDGVGFMKGGKRWNDGRNRIPDKAAYAH